MHTTYAPVGHKLIIKSNGGILMIIITQDNELVVFENMKTISTYSGTVENTEIFAVVASDEISDEVNDKNAVWLGIYNDKDECDTAINMLIDAIADEHKIFQMPNAKVVD